MTRPTISVVVNTLNEEKNLPASLGSVRAWADEIIVVDMHSDDRTREVAEALGAKVFLHERMGFVEPARAFALSKTSSDWILILDADELVLAPLAERLASVAREGRDDAVRIPRLNYMMGKPLRYTGWGPASDAQLRFFRRGMLGTTDQIHGLLQRRPGARVSTLPVRDGLALVHFNYVDLAQFVEKMNRYTTVEAKQAAERGERGSIPGSALRASWEFVDRYVFKRGFLDGWRGFYLSALMAAYRVSTAAKLREIRSGAGRAAVEKAYAEVAHDVLAGYPEGARRRSEP
ncbi:MAG: glycosyltransferase family 2 protein [Sandaracinaceae bacterium]|nr:glycosyltransferase family 2 protein [Sandaracinaceae bacterium]